MNIKILLGKRIKILRKSRKLTQEKLAEMVGVDTSSISNIENGKFFPSAETLDKIIDTLNITPSLIFECESLQPNDNLIEEINNMLNNNPDKIQDVYKIVKALVN